MWCKCLCHETEKRKKKGARKNKHGIDGVVTRKQHDDRTISDKKVTVHVFNVFDASDDDDDDDNALSSPSWQGFR